MDRYRMDVHLDEATLLGTLADDVRRGLTASRKSLPPKYFYDPIGSALFERITQLPEYYLTRVERGLVLSFAEEMMEELRELARGIDDWEQRLGTALVKSSPTDLVRHSTNNPDAERQKSKVKNQK